MNPNPNRKPLGANLTNFEGEIHLSAAARIRIAMLNVGVYLLSHLRFFIIYGFLGDSVALLNCTTRLRREENNVNYCVFQQALKAFFADVEIGKSLVGTTESERSIFNAAGIATVTASISDFNR